MLSNVFNCSQECICMTPVFFEDQPLVDLDSVVGTVTRYGLDGPGIEYRWGRDFPHPVQTGPGAHPASCTICTRSLSRG
jgi:hypothetical protein